MGNGTPMASGGRPAAMSRAPRNRALFACLLALSSMCSFRGDCSERKPQLVVLEELLREAVGETVVELGRARQDARVEAERVREVALARLGSDVIAIAAQSGAASLASCSTCDSFAW